MESRTVKEMKELIRDLKKDYYIPIKYRTWDNNKWQLERPRYIKYLEHRLERLSYG